MPPKPALHIYETSPRCFVPEAGDAMKVVVTGGAGYIGATTVQALLESGHEVVVYDNLTKGHSQAVPLRARLVRGEIDDRPALDALFQDYRPESVLHFAA